MILHNFTSLVHAVQRQQKKRHSAWFLPFINFAFVCLFDFQNELLGHETVQKKIDFCWFQFKGLVELRSSKKEWETINRLTKRPESDVDFKKQAWLISYSEVLGKVKWDASVSIV